MSDTVDLSTPARHVDIDDDDFAPVPKHNVLGKLLEQAKEKVVRPLVMYPVPERKGWEVEYDPNITSEQMEEWRKRASKGRKEGFNALQFSCLILANQCRAIYLDGEKAFDDEVEPVTFRSRELWEATGSARAAECVRRVYGLDSHVNNVAFKVLEEAGYSDEVDSTTDPT